jgi:hypothetical protein
MKTLELYKRTYPRDNTPPNRGDGGVSENPVSPTGTWSDAVAGFSQAGTVTRLRAFG